jgi:hypothetical protein
VPLVFFVPALSVGLDTLYVPKLMFTVAQNPLIQSLLLLLPLLLLFAGHHPTVCPCSHSCLR